MKSIRLSLVLYFLALIAAALGAVSVLAYQNTERVLQSKEAIRRQLLQDQFKKNCDETRRRLDWALLRLAASLEGQAQGQIHKSRMSGQPMVPSELQFNEQKLPPHREGDVVEYFQVNVDTVTPPWRSRSLGERSFPFDAATFAKMEFHQAQFGELELAPGTQVRHLTWKADPTRPWFGRPRPGMTPQRTGQRRPPPATQEPPERPPVPILIQCAAETTHRDAALKKLQGELDTDLANLKAESSDTLAGLRNRLLLINLSTFAAIVVGGFWLVGLGLAPLRRLSDAVSLVSAKDFRLAFDDRRLPHELRPIVERLTATLDLLKRTFAREKQAAADISHELRTPLAALLTTVEVALRKARSPEEYREVLADCHATGQQMSQLVERLLALARLDAGVDTMRPRTVEVTALAEQCAAMVRPLAEARGLTLEFHRNGPIQLSMDPDKLREIVTNLLHNAIEYNQPNGRVDMTVEGQNGHLQVEVSDTGIGIAPEAREHIFERFYRADPSRHAEGLHAGLGLAIVKGYVDLMGGTIAVESTPGKGSTFRLELPLQTQERPASLS
jgi:heavy metal sensor kinase